jgi:hypothetical protein
VLLDGLNKSKRALVIGILNGDPRATLAWSRDYNSIHLPLPGDTKGDASKVLRGHASFNKRTGKHFFRPVDIAALEKIEPQIEEHVSRGARVVRALETLRNLPLEQLQQALGSRLWRCRKCQKFFMATDARYRAYCTRLKCGKNYEAEKATKKRRELIRATKLRAARRAQSSCPPDRDWKEFVATETGVSKNFLTYAVKYGDLKDVGRASV